MRTSRATRVGAIACWLVVVVVSTWIVAHARFVADLSAFLPTDPTPEQKLLIDQLREGPASHLILMSIEGGRSPLDGPTLAKVSREMASRLRGDARFLSINNGEIVTAAADRAFLYDHRYLLSDQVTAPRFAAAGLREALDESLDLLSSSAGLMLQPLITRDPTAELLHVIDSLTGGRDLPTIDGVWVSDGKANAAHALVIAETRAAGSDIDGQQIAIDALRVAFEASKQVVGASADAATLVLSGPPVFAVESRNTIEREARHLSLIGLALVAMLLGFVYRSPRALVLGLLPMATGAITGLAVVAAGFGLVHGIALGFGVTLIGEAVDYAIYLFVQRAGETGDSSDGSRFWNTIMLGVGTSVIGFGALLFSGFQGLAQIGLLSIVGLVVAAAVTRWVLPAMLPVGFTVRSMPRVGSALQRVAEQAPRLRWEVLVIVVAAVVVLVVHRDRLWSRELGSLSPLSTASQETDQRLRSELGAPDVRDIVVITAGDREGALRGSEDVVRTLAPFIASGTLLGVEAPSRYLPSQATQRLRQAALPDDATLRRDFATSLQGLPFTKTGFDGFFSDVARERIANPIDETDLGGTSLGPALRALLSKHGGDGAQAGWTAVVALRSAPAIEVPRAQIAAGLAQLEANGKAPGAANIRLIDIRNETQNLYASYLSEAVRTAGFGRARHRRAARHRAPERLTHRSRARTPRTRGGARGGRSCGVGRSAQPLPSRGASADRRRRIELRAVLRSPLAVGRPRRRRPAGPDVADRREPHRGHRLRRPEPVFAAGAELDRHDGRARCAARARAVGDLRAALCDNRKLMPCTCVSLSSPS